MNMFENYENLNSQYIPTNISRAPIKPQCPPNICQPEIPNKPYEDYNAKGELVGYWWNYGDTINLDFNLSGYVTVDGSNDYIDVLSFIQNKQINITLYNFRHEQITNMLFEGKDYKDLKYDIVPVNQFTRGIFYVYSNETGEYSPVDLPQDYNKDITYYEGNLSIVFPIDKELSQALVPGVYYCSLTIIGEESTITVVNDNECTLTVR